MPNGKLVCKSYHTSIKNGQDVHVLVRIEELWPQPHINTATDLLSPLIQQHWDRLVGTAQHLAEMKAGS